MGFFNELLEKIIKEDYSKVYDYEIIDEFPDYCRLLSYHGDRKKVIIPFEIETLIVKEIGSKCFANNDNIEEIVFEEVNSVETINYEAFKNCKNLKKITFPYAINSIDSSVCEDCISLEEVKLNYRLTEIQNNAFKNCNLKSIIIPDNVTKIGSEAFSCKKLTNIIISENSELEEIENNAFENSKIKEFYIPKKLKELSGGAFCSCENLEKIIVSSENEWFTEKDGMLLTKDNKTLGRFNQNNEKYINQDKFILPSYIETIGIYAFDSAKFNSISFEENNILKGIDYYAFQKTKLTSFEIPASLETLKGRIFSETNLNEITINPKNKNFVSIDGIIYSADKKKLICYLPTRTEKEYKVEDFVEIIGCGAFSDCENLEKLIIPDSVTTIEDEVANSSNKLKEIIVGENVKTIGKKSFAYNEMLMKITFPENCKLEIIEEDALANNELITEITIPRFVTKIGESALSYCSNLLTVNFHPEAQLLEIGDYAFEECSNLTEITIPLRVNKICDCAFQCCNITDIKIYSKKIAIGEYTFDENNIQNISAYGNAIFEYYDEKYSAKDFVEQLSVELELEEEINFSPLKIHNLQNETKINVKQENRGANSMMQAQMFANKPNDNNK
ncbi:MAG: leucine-rich repeat domain-containing protein [Bacteroidales bacterium]|nr:leucine-rich repeat domain-containing protein [Bacteroidales bacterium]